MPAIVGSAFRRGDKLFLVPSCFTTYVVPIVQELRVASRITVTWRKRNCDLQKKKKGKKKTCDKEILNSVFGIQHRIVEHVPLLTVGVIASLEDRYLRCRRTCRILSLACVSKLPTEGIIPASRGCNVKPLSRKRLQPTRSSASPTESEDVR